MATDALATQGVNLVLNIKYNAVTSWARWCLKSPAYRLFAQQFVQAQIKENINETGDQWIPLTKGQ